MFAHCTTSLQQCNKEKTTNKQTNKQTTTTTTTTNLPNNNNEPFEICKNVITWIHSALSQFPLYKISV
jgi:hypothetical protein